MELIVYFLSGCSIMSLYFVCNNSVGDCASLRHMLLVELCLLLNLLVVVVCDDVVTGIVLFLTFNRMCCFFKVELFLS